MSTVLTVLAIIGLLLIIVGAVLWFAKKGTLLLVIGALIYALVTLINLLMGVA